ncbi:hypothetical protein [Mesorhizobium temperatum]|uniref:Uncharacterized protein n=1 Tax=Mesorhizobium temperatum TaxID=241416 RepID=A0A271LQE8_9HYPH|nr:hypothetical protein [Mesorhizobium temperatum]PAQ09550.1 hypothetical protein CIT26_13585 [Mesorhizobium temperatum]
MNKNTAGAVLVLIIAAAGLVYDKPWAWGFAAATCALAFLAEKLSELDTVGAAILRLGFALLSWATVVAAFIALTA